MAPSSSVNQTRASWAGTYRIAFGPRAGQRGRHGASHGQGFSPALVGALVPFAPPTGAALSIHHAPSLRQRALAMQRRRAGRAQTQDRVAERPNAHRDVTDGFMQLAVLVPWPRLHPIRLHGVLPPNSKLRAMVVPQGA